MGFRKDGHLDAHCACPQHLRDELNLIEVFDPCVILIDVASLDALGLQQSVCQILHIGGLHEGDLALGAAFYDIFDGSGSR
jgi:hypothetical protein